MPICMYPAVAAPDRNAPNYAKQGKPEAGGSIRQGSAVVPGEIIFRSGSNLITGHGTYRDADSETVGAESIKMDINAPSSLEADAVQTGTMRTSLIGRVRIVNKLVYIETPKARYAGNVGDMVVGRIVEVEQRRWRVDVNSALRGNLALANVKLPGGELRRKSEDDERAMRSFMKEGDLVVAEVHEVFKDGSLQLHMPGTRTGKLGGGSLLRIPPSLVKRQKIHRHRLAVPRADSTTIHNNTSTEANQPTSQVVSVGLILGCNGHVWIGPARAMDIGLGLAAPTDVESGTHETIADQVAERIAVSRVRNCILALTHHGIPVWETSVLTACEASWFTDHHGDGEDEDEDDEDVNMTDETTTSQSSRVRNRISRLLRPDVSRQLVALVKNKLQSTF